MKTLDFVEENHVLLLVSLVPSFLPLSKTAKRGPQTWIIKHLFSVRLETAICETCDYVTI